MKKYLFLAGLFLTLILSVCALADFTVNKPMYEAFQMFNPDGSARTNCDLTKFTTKTWINDVPTAMTWTFRNLSTGDYDAIGTPAIPGDVRVFISYSGGAGQMATDNVRTWDIDTMYGSAGPRMANLSTATSRLGSPLQTTNYIAPPSAFSLATTVDLRLSSTHPGNWAATGTAYVNWTSGESYFASKHGSGTWGASGSGIRTVTVSVKDSITKLPLPDVGAQVYDNSTSINVATGTTGSDGTVKFNLDDGSYQVRLRKSMVNFNPLVAPMQVSSTSTFANMSGTTFSPTTPALGLQTVYGYIVGVNGVAAQGVQVTAKITRQQAVSSTVISNQVLVAVTDPSGYFELQLVKGSVVTVSAGGFWTKRITVTSDNSKNIGTY